MKRFYIDKKGKERTLTFLKESIFVHWHKIYPGSMSTIWLDEKRDHIRIPDNAWKCLGVNYEDK